MSDLTLTKYFVYGYVCPESHRLRYVGKGSRDRASVHWTRATHGRPVMNKRLEGWLVDLSSRGLRPIIVKLAQNLNEDEALLLEAQLIFKNGIQGRSKKGVLLNIRQEKILRGEDHVW
jgi:hypothetical protein